MTSVELFAGAGGLAMGISNAGFRHKAVLEINKDACNTIRANQRRKIGVVVDWPLVEGDVRDFPFEDISAGTDLLAAGVPCQPWSLGGKHQAHKDERNMFPHLIHAIRELRPKAILVENVKGLKRRSFAKYLEYIILMISHPEVFRKPGQGWLQHKGELERYHTAGHEKGLEYNVVFDLLNAANYGVPQKRERVFIVGFRSDLEIEWSFPQPTHSIEALLVDQWITGAYWDRHEIPKSRRPQISLKLMTRKDHLANFKTLDHPWVTVRDATSDLPDPETTTRVTLPNHVLNPGARSYPGHTGSPLDEPAKTLKAGVHGVPGGENMVALPDGRVRYFTVRESARLQTFPDEYVFCGAWSEAMRQLGNAVPVRLAEVIASDIGRRIAAHAEQSSGNARRSI